MAKFDDKVKREIIALDSRGLPEAEIIRQIRAEFGILKELVRKHLAGLAVLKDLERRSLPIPPELDGSDLLQRRFRILRGTVTYLRNLSRLVDSLAGGGQAAPPQELDGASATDRRLAGSPAPSLVSCSLEQPVRALASTEGSCTVVVQRLRSHPARQASYRNKADPTRHSADGPRWQCRRRV